MGIQRLKVVGKALARAAFSKGAVVPLKWAIGTLVSSLTTKDYDCSCCDKGLACTSKINCKEGAN